MLRTRGCRAVLLGGAGVTGLLTHRRTICAAEPSSKGIVEAKLTVSAGVEGDFALWLPTYLKKIIELPGLLGAKVLRPMTPPSPPKPAVVFVLGGPGAGKGTQSQMIVDAYGYTHLSAGDLLRAERKSGSEQGKMIDEYIAEGKIVPVEVTVKLLADAINDAEQKTGCKRFLVDGFPRNTNNLSGWQNVVGDKLEVAGVLFYDCPEDVMEARLLERGKTSGRTDDNIESIRKRFHTYTAETTPVLQYYDHQKLVHHIDGTRELEAVWEDTKAAVETMEGSLSSAPETAAFVVQLYLNDPHDDLAASLLTRLQSDADKRWGKDAVSISGCLHKVIKSMKAFDLDVLRAFD